METMRRAMLALAVGTLASCTETVLPSWQGCAPYLGLAWQAGGVLRDDVNGICYDEAARGVMLGRPDSPGCEVRVEVDLGGQGPSDAPGWRDHTEGFAWQARHDGSKLAIAISATTARGARYGVDAALAALGTLPERAADWPAFETRGVIEGFYNRYFTRQERAETLRLMRGLRLNRYLYAPKDDEYAGYRWREPYPESALEDLRDAAAAASVHDVDFVWGVSPTLSTNGRDPAASIRFSSEADFETLVEKVERLRALGVPRFAVLYDDASNLLAHEEDRARFGSAAAAHADLANRLVARVGGPLLFVGVAYNNGTERWLEYNEILGRVLDPAVEVMWTGPSTFPERITPDDLMAIDTALGRPVVLWDNWPTAPVPVTGRDPDLPTMATGILTNATLVGDFGHTVRDFWRVLGPVGDYAWRPTRYDAWKAFESWQGLAVDMPGCR